MEAIRESSYPNLIYRGKVRDTHDIGNNKYLMVSTDRISAYDVVLPNVVPGKGSVLNQISSFWFAKTEHIVNNHFIELGIDSNDLELEYPLATRSMVVKKANRVDVECIVRGYITGSAWSEYKSTGKVSGMSMPEGLKEGDKFPEPLFTPTTKADEGHDENMTMQEVIDMVGTETADKLTELSISIYNYAHDFALAPGIIIADTKMEFGFIQMNNTQVV